MDKDPPLVWVRLGTVDEHITIAAAEPYEAGGRP
jgi:hypothetical protein